MTDQPASLTLLALGGVPMIEAGADLAAVILAALDGAGQRLADGDVIVLAQKIVSKAEGRLIDLASVEASQQATDIAGKVDKDPRLVELVLGEAQEVMRVRPGVLIVRHRLEIGRA
ncbi:MAG: coenzyme F420-0:L-glutamate ligase, partial [Rhizorhabdus sp.]